MKKRILLYAHTEKEDVLDKWAEIGGEQGGEAEQMAKFLGTEVELVFDVDMQTGDGVLVAANGRFLGDEEVTPGEAL
jgi:hypothetical protein